MTAVALTPAILFSLILTIFLPSQSPLGLVFLALGLGYIIYATQAIKNPDTPTDPAED
ncbi:MAG: hypothetical protein HC904_03645 [Blastochloris sp.]|nr:hypothetical protein [Blastochloris sp.]